MENHPSVYPPPLLRSGLKIETLDHIFNGYISDDEKELNGWVESGYWSEVKDHIESVLGDYFATSIDDYIHSLERAGFCEIILRNIRHNLSILKESHRYGRFIHNHVITRERMADAAFRIASTEVQYNASSDLPLELAGDFGKEEEEGGVWSLDDDGRDGDGDRVVPIGPIYFGSSSPNATPTQQQHMSSPNPRLTPYITSPPYLIHSPPSFSFLYHGASSSSSGSVSSYALAGPIHRLPEERGTLNKGKAVYYSNQVAFGICWGSYYDITGPKRWRRVKGIEDCDALVHVIRVEKELLDNALKLPRLLSMDEMQAYRLRQSRGLAHPPEFDFIMAPASMVGFPLLPTGYGADVRYDRQKPPEGDQSLSCEELVFFASTTFAFTKKLLDRTHSVLVFGPNVTPNQCEIEKEKENQRRKSRDRELATVQE